MWKLIMLKKLYLISYKIMINFLEIVKTYRTVEYIWHGEEIWIIILLMSSNNIEKEKNKQNFRLNNIVNWFKKIFSKNHSANKKRDKKKNDDDQNPNIYTFW